jgi:hypothetical protein
LKEYSPNHQPTRLAWLSIVGEMGERIDRIQEVVAVQTKNDAPQATLQSVEAMLPAQRPNPKHAD